MLKHLIRSPRKLFLVDGLGALNSAFMLGVVLVYFEAYIGMPRSMLYFLALLAGLFALYSWGNYLWFRENWRPYLRAIALINLSYCALTAGLVVVYRATLTGWGIGYFALELLIVVTLALVEWNVAQKRTPPEATSPRVE